MMTYAAGMHDPLSRSIVISLFTWRRAAPSDPVDGGDLQGWWGDSYPSVADDRIGSRLWLLRRRTLDKQTVVDAVHYAEESLQWMIDDGLVLAVNVTAQRQSIERLYMRVECVRSAGSGNVVLDFNDIWKVIQNAD